MPVTEDLLGVTFERRISFAQVEAFVDRGVDAVLTSSKGIDLLLDFTVKGGDIVEVVAQFKREARASSRFRNLVVEIGASDPGSIDDNASIIKEGIAILTIIISRNQAFEKITEVKKTLPKFGQLVSQASGAQAKRQVTDTEREEQQTVNVLGVREDREEQVQEAPLTGSDGTDSLGIPQGDLGESTTPESI